MALDEKELKNRRIKGLNKIRTDLRIQFKEIVELGIDIDQPMLEIHKNLDLILIKLGYVQKEPYTGPERRDKDRSAFSNQCQIIQNGGRHNST